MNSKKRKEKEIKRGLMNSAERNKLHYEKMEILDKRKQGKKYKKPLINPLDQFKK